MYSKKYIHIKYGIRSAGFLLIFLLTLVGGDWVFRHLLSNNIRGQTLIYGMLLLTFMLFVISLGHWYVKLHDRH